MSKQKRKIIAGVQLDMATYLKLRKLAKREQVSMSALVRQALTKKLASEEA